MSYTIDCNTRAKGRTGRSVFITGGDGGIGKTALVDEFRRPGVPPQTVLSTRIAQGQLCVEGYGGKEGPITRCSMRWGRLCAGPAGNLDRPDLGRAPSPRRGLVQFPGAWLKKTRAPARRCSERDPGRHA